MTRVPVAIREQVRRRANERCEYCRTPQKFHIAPFHVDHIVPPKQNGSSEAIENLAWACDYCNVHKGSVVASYDPITGELAPLFNPRTQNWSDHFEIENGTIAAKTPSGRVTIIILEMNSPKRVQMRDYLIRAGRW